VCINVHEQRLRGENERKESKRVVKTAFAVFNWDSKIPAIDLVSLSMPNKGAPEGSSTTEEGETSAAKPACPRSIDIHLESCMKRMRVHQVEKGNRHGLLRAPPPKDQGKDPKTKM
jgi:hypothetical protein